MFCLRCVLIYCVCFLACCFVLLYLYPGFIRICECELMVGSGLIGLLMSYLFGFTFSAIFISVLISCLLF